MPGKSAAIYLISWISELLVKLLLICNEYKYHEWYYDYSNQYSFWILDIQYSFVVGEVLMYQSNPSMTLRPHLTDYRRHRALRSRRTLPRHPHAGSCARGVTWPRDSTQRRPLRSGVVGSRRSYAGFQGFPSWSRVVIRTTSHWEG